MRRRELLFLPPRFFVMPVSVPVAYLSGWATQRPPLSRHRLLHPP
jgi:hypothetical protein